MLEKNPIAESNNSIIGNSTRANGSSRRAQIIETDHTPGLARQIRALRNRKAQGRRAFASVVKAIDKKLYRGVAIKLMNPELALLSAPCKRFLREARADSAVTHENIVAGYAVEDDPITYLAME